MAFFFYIFALMAVLGSLCVITSRNPVHSVLWLIFTFCSGSGLMILIGAEFIAMMLIIIYVGAVAVLFLFVVMMLNVNASILKSAFGKNLLLTSVILLLLFANLTLVVMFSSGIVAPSSEYGFTISSDMSDVKAIGQVLYTKFILPFQVSGVILFVAMVASIVLTMRKRSGVKKQDVQKQLLRNKENSIMKAVNDGKEGLNNLAYDD